MDLQGSGLVGIKLSVSKLTFVRFAGLILSFLLGFICMFLAYKLFALE